MTPEQAKTLKVGDRVEAGLGAFEADEALFDKRTGEVMDTDPYLGTITKVTEDGVEVRWDGEQWAEPHIGTELVTGRDLEWLWKAEQADKGEAA